MLYCTVTPSCLRLAHSVPSTLSPPTRTSTLRNTTTSRDKMAAEMKVDEFLPEVAEGAAPAMEALNNNDDLGDFGDVDEVGKEIQVSGDGGVVKKILQLGEGWEMPEKGDEVEVHYVGTLEADGSKFDSSRDRDDTFKFTLGEGRVIKAWDQGVATMKRGEKSLLICRADYAYGAAGSPPKIPPNATLHFEVELIGWRSIKDISGDGGVIKTIVEEADGWATCKDEYEAIVSYRAKVAGAEAWAVDVPEATFTVSEGHFVPGLPVAVRSMKRGEKVHLKLKPDYGFGAAGSEEFGIPPNAELEMELTLVNWHHVDDIMDDGLVLKKTLRTDEDSYKKPNEGASVTVRLTGRLPDGTVFDEYTEEGKELTFVTCEEQVCDGLDEAVLKMKEGDLAVVYIKDAKYGFGDKGHTGALAAVPPNSPIEYTVELVKFQNAKESFEMSDDEKVEAAKVFKEKGNAFFKCGKLAKAEKMWDKAVSLVQYDKSFTEDAKVGAREVKRSAWLNMAAVVLKKGQFKEAAKHCDKVLEIESSNVKALYRRAQAYIGTGDLLEAEQDLRNASYAEPDNADVAALTKKLKLLIKQQNKKEATLYSKMFKPAPAVKADAAPASDAAPMEVLEPAAPAVAPEPVAVDADMKDQAVAAQ